MDARPVTLMRLGGAVSPLLLAVLLTACGGGASTQSLPDTSGPASLDYTGPPPATADVQAFRVNVWENLRSDSRCGACHGAGGQAPTFVDFSATTAGLPACRPAPIPWRHSSRPGPAAPPAGARRSG